MEEGGGWGTSPHNHSLAKQTISHVAKVHIIAELHLSLQMLPNTLLPMSLIYMQPIPQNKSKTLPSLLLQPTIYLDGSGSGDPLVNEGFLRTDGFARTGGFEPDAVPPVDNATASRYLAASFGVEGAGPSGGLSEADLISTRTSEDTLRSLRASGSRGCMAGSRARTMLETEVVSSVSVILNSVASVFL